MALRAMGHVRGTAVDELVHGAELVSRRLSSWWVRLPAALPPSEPGPSAAAQPAPWRRRERSTDAGERRSRIGDAVGDASNESHEVASRTLCACSANRRTRSLPPWSLSW